MTVSKGCWTCAIIAAVVALLFAGTAVGGFVVWNSHRANLDKMRGGQLTYRLLFPDGYRGDRPAAAKEAANVVAHRLEARKGSGFRVDVMGEDEVVVEIDGVDRAAFETYPPLLAIGS